MKQKKREKTQANGQEGIIWMKGMQDILNLKIDSSNNSEKETNYSVNSNNQNNAWKKNPSNHDLIEIDKEPKQSKNHAYNNNNNNYYNNYNDLKDKEDYLNVHKMLFDLNNIQREEEGEIEEEDEEENEAENEEIDIDDVNSLTRDFTLLSVHLNSFFIK